MVKSVRISVQWNLLFTIFSKNKNLVFSFLQLVFCKTKNKIHQMYSISMSIIRLTKFMTVLSGKIINLFSLKSQYH